MTALAIASTARCDFVFQPTRPTLDSRNQVLGGGSHEVGVYGSTTPHTRTTVALQDRCQARPSVHRRFGQGLDQRLRSMSATRNANSRLCSRFNRGSHAVSYR